MLGIKECSPYDKEGYQEENKSGEYLEDLVDGFICNDASFSGSSKSESGFINISIIFFILLIMLNI